MMVPTKPRGPMGPIYRHVARRRPRRVKAAVASPYLNSIFLNLIFSLGRLSSDALSLNLDMLGAGVLQARCGEASLFYHLGTLFVIDL